MSRTITSELLSFMLHKIDITPRDIILKVCHDFYRVEEVSLAKESLIKILTDVERTKFADEILSNRRSVRLALEDIYSILHGLERSSVQCFAQNLDRIPPMNLEQIDLVTLLIAYNQLRAEISEMKTVVAKLSGVPSTIISGDLPSAPCTTQDCLVANIVSASSVCNEAPEAMSIPAASVSYKAPEVVSATSVFNDAPEAIPPSVSAAVSRDKVIKKVFQDRKLNKNLASSAINVKNKPSYAAIATKTTRKGVIVGAIKRGNVSGIRSALELERRSIFVSRLARDMSSVELKKCLASKLKIPESVVDVELKTSQRNQSSASFRVSFPALHVDTLMNPAFWPMGILVRKFYAHKVKSTEAPLLNNICDNDA